VADEFKKAYKEFYPMGAKESPDYARIVNINQFRRLKAMLDDSKGKVLLGGAMDENELFIEPTVVQIDSVDDSLCTQESFGPIITILPVENLDQAISIANGIQSTPLGLYPFGSKADIDKSTSRSLT
jgi:beta-apo-4'-carotenal oxygenase